MMVRDKSINKFYAFALAAVFSLTLAGCGGGGGTAEEPPAPMPPTPEEMCADAGNHWVDGACLTPSENTVRMALAAIAAAATAADAQAAYDAVKDDVSAAQGDALQAAVDARAEELATMARIDAQKMALADAAGAIDTSDLTSRDAVTAANMAIAALEAAIAAADDVDDTSMYQTMVDNAKAAVATAVAALDLGDARDMQMAALTTASEALTTALAGLTGTPTQDQIDAVQMAVDNLNAAIQGGTDLSDAEKASSETAVATANARIDQAKQTLADNNARADEERKAQEEADRKAAEEKAAEEAAAMAALAQQLYGAIGTTALDDTARPTVYSATTFSADPDGSGSADVVSLSENDDATVADHYDWSGKMYTADHEAAAGADDANDGTYEAVVYSTQGDPTPGQPFSTQYTANLDDGVLDTTTTEGTPSRVASPQFDQSAGWKRFPLPDPNPGLATRVSIPGTYHGVPGTYHCVPGADNVCAVRKDAGNAFTLGGVANDGTFTASNGEWTFMPTNPMTRVMGTADGNYLAYGWWIHKDADGDPAAVRAFTAVVGTVDAAAGITALQGSATYMGGAAGKYALRSSTGGTNDAGHFTARATLEANFSTNMVTGTIDNFTGADGQSRDWSVELMESGVGDTGTILGSDGTGTAMMTKWTIGGTPGANAGSWQGKLYDNGDDGVPSLGTGTFSSTYGTDGTMVGAFGVNKQ